ncbi:MAG: hypothetical protein AAF443_09105 [Chlamydiota bacterium]
MDSSRSSKEELPPLVLSYRALPATEQLMMAIQEQWSRELGLRVQLKKSDYKAHIAGEFQLGEAVFCSKSYDPSYKLSFFRKKQLKVNLSNWECSVYCNLLDQADHETNNEKRSHLLKQAEKMFIEEMPVTSDLFYQGAMAAKSAASRGGGV